MNLIFKLMWFDKKTEEHVGEIVITHLFSEKELMELVNEKEELCDSYRLSKTQFEHIAKKTLTPHSEKYNYYLDISGDYTLDLRDCVWIPAPASEFTDKDPIDRLDAEKAFLSHDPEKIIDALIRVVFFDPDPFYIQAKCIEYLNSNNIAIQKEAIIGIGHLVRMHGNIDTQRILPILKSLEKNSALAEAIEETLDNIESFQNVKRQGDDEEE